MGAWIEPLSGVVRHLPGDKDRLVADDGRDKPRAWRRADSAWVDLADLPPWPGLDREQRRRDGRARAKAALHDDRRARRDVVAKFRVTRQVIGIDRFWR